VVEQFRVGSSHSRASASRQEGLSEAQLQELVATVQAEIVQPLQTRIRDLVTQVKALRAETNELEQRWQSSQNSGSGKSSKIKILSQSRRPVLSLQETEANLAAEFESLFRAGQVDDAFSRAASAQTNARYEDYLWKVCSLVTDELDSWLEGPGGKSPLGMPTKMALMMSLAQQLEADPAQAHGVAKVDWISELCFAFEAYDPSVEASAASSCASLAEVLEKLASGPPEIAEATRKLKRSVQQASRLLQNK